MNKKLNILIATDSFKGSMSSIEASEAIEKGLKESKIKVNIKKIPMADGGEGTVDALILATGGEKIYRKVLNPLGKEIEAFFGVLGDKKTAVIEMASASGIGLINENERNPMETTSYGTGELILSAIKDGYKKIIIGIGGSATNDGGMGMLRALGIKFLDEFNNILIGRGRDLIDAYRIDLTGMKCNLKDIEIILACDVDNPLYGENGAAYIYGKQKGADDEMIEILDKGLRNYGKIIDRYFKNDFSKYSGAGAAGGMGIALMAFFDCKVYRGVDMVIKYSNLERYIIESDIVISGEGKIDRQTYSGKTPYGVGKLGKKYGKKVIIFAGILGDGYDYDLNSFADQVVCIGKKECGINENMKNGYKNLMMSAKSEILGYNFLL